MIRKEIFMEDMTMREKQGANIFESIPEQSFFDYSLGGYSHRERWSRAR
jgi:hypothetical protein